MLARALKLRIPISLQVKYNFSQWDWEAIPKPWNVKCTKEEKRLLHNKKNSPFPKYVGKLHDTLHMAGLEGDKLLFLYQDFLQSKDTPLSSQNVALLLYNFAKGGYLNHATWPRLQTYITRNRGQFSLRSIFGCLYGCIIYGREDFLQFFVEQMKGQNLSFTDMEAVQIIEAFNLSKHNYSPQVKFDFWDTYFKPHYVSTITPQVRIHKLENALKIFDAFNKFEYYHDEDIWNNILSWLERRKGWKRIEIIQRLYPLTGTFPKAKEIFDTYYAELSVNKHVQWRYNLEELRLYSSEEMIAKSQQNIQMNPSDRTLFKRKDQKELNESYHEWLLDGARQKEAELVKDKAQSLAYAIKNRYDSLKKDNVDFSKLSVEEFQDLFGAYDKQMMYKAQNEMELESLEEVQKKLQAREYQQGDGRKKKKKQSS